MLAFSLPLMLASATQAPPSPPPPADIVARLRDKATDPQTLKKEAGQVKTCALQTDGRAPDPKDKWRASAGTGFTAAPSPTADPQFVPDEERTPTYFPAGHRPDASAFTVVGPDGKSLSVSAFAGRPVIVFFFRLDCLHALEMMPEVARLHPVENRFGFKVLPVCISGEGWGAIEHFQKQNEKVLPPGFSIYKPSLTPGQGTSLFPLLRFAPTTYLLDDTGRVGWRVVGRVIGSLSDKLNLLLAERNLRNSQAGK
ncbi:MAG: TlpA family protein disulfide reductase [Acidobacteria bacterium]|nr:TlpA family protein disulfide reductase [Acidobacteriota bacterium]